jgi:hypothetical protein
MAKKTQIQQFREAARKLEADESEEWFDVALKAVAKAPVSPKESKPETKKPAR